MIEVMTNAPTVAKAIQEYANRIDRGTSRLIQMIGTPLRDDTKGRISSQNKGTWAPLSKWGRAKGKDVPLQGLSRTVKFRLISKNQGEVYAELPLGQDGKPWSLTQHHKGFENKPPSHALVVIPLRRPSELSLPSSRRTFSWIERRSGKTPARQIWPTKAQVEKVVNIEVARWLEIMANA